MDWTGTELKKRNDCSNTVGVNYINQLYMEVLRELCTVKESLNKGITQGWIVLPSWDHAAISGD